VHRIAMFLRHRPPGSNTQSTENHMHPHFPRLLPLSPLALAVLLAMPHSQALAQQSVEEIIVTADFRQGALDDIPASITVLDADLIEKRNARHLEDLLLN